MTLTFKRQATLFLLLILISLYSGCTHTPPVDVKAETFKKLSLIKEAKKSEVKNYFTKVRQKASEVAGDKNILRLFNGIGDYYAKNNLRKIKDSLFTLDQDLDILFVTKYYEFYDILFVDRAGYVFHSVKRESDYHTNLFYGRWSDSHLALKLKENSGEQFVDYDYYAPSDEAAAFFVTPVNKNNKHAGWIILQAPINKLNTILSNHENLGRTGEVYLVNKKKLMLTDSRFISDSTILKHKVDTEAVRLAFKNSEGQKIIKDYRGVKVFSVFERFEVFNNSWVIIVEIDEDEVITDLYRQYKKYFLPIIMTESLKKKVNIKDPSLMWTHDKNIKRADISEFRVSRKGEILETRGVGPCSSVIIYHPDNFAYLSHISPVDDAYGNDYMTKLLLKDRRTSFLEKIISKIKHYEIYPYQLKELKVALVATHFESMERVVDDILDAGFDLSQIKVIINPYADYANVRFDPSTKGISIEWVSQLKSSYGSDRMQEDMGTIVKNISGYGA